MNMQTDSYKIERALRGDSDILEEIAVKAAYLRKHNDSNSDPRVIEMCEKVTELMEDIDKANDAETKRILDFWRSHLGKFYYMTVTHDLDKTVKRGYYIYPYDVIEGNRRVSCLIINPHDSYAGGVKTEHISIDDGSYFTDFCTVKLHECSKQEFYVNAVARVDAVIERRLEKENNKDKEEKYNVTLDI